MSRRTSDLLESGRADRSRYYVYEPVYPDATAVAKRRFSQSVMSTYVNTDQEYCKTPCVRSRQAYLSYAVRVLAVPASFACRLTQTNDSLPLLAYSDGTGMIWKSSGITSRLTRLLDIWPSVCCLAGSAGPTGQLAWPARQAGCPPAAHFTDLHRSFIDSSRQNTRIYCLLTSCAPSRISSNLLCVVPHRSHISPHSPG